MATYRPMLKTKSGEVQALSNLTQASADKMSPVFVMVSSPPQNFGKRLANAWSGRQISLYGNYNATSNGTVQYFVDCFHEAGRNEVPIIPAFSINDDPSYLAEVESLFNQYGQGAVVVASTGDLKSIDSWIQQNGWSQNELDIVIDLDDISQVPTNLLETSIPEALNSNIGSPPAWRSVTLCGFSAPLHFGDIQAPRAEIYRLEWLLWQSVSPQLGWTLDYGDKGPTSPSLEDPPGVAMASATVSVRYTVLDRWILLKGRPASGRSGQPMLDQYSGHAQTLVAEPDFDQLPACWADDYISGIANGTYRAGSRAIWASIMINRHLELVGNTIP